MDRLDEGDFTDFLSDQERDLFRELTDKINESYDKVGKKIKSIQESKKKGESLAIKNSIQKEINSLMEEQRLLMEERSPLLDKLSEAKSETIKNKRTEVNELYDQIYKYQTQILGGGKKAIENSLIGNIVDLLSQPRNFNALTTPNNTDIFYQKDSKVQGMSEAEMPIANEMSSAKAEGYDPRANVQNDNSNFSATRVLEWGYNLYKHRSNSIGKQALGIGAVDNTYNTLFNAIGMYLESEKNTISENKLNSKDINKNFAKVYKNFLSNLGSNSVPRTLKFKHNKVGDSISLSDLRDAEGKHSISDVINQLINGWVDIAAEAWVFDIQADKELAPMLLFLAQAGVPVKDAVYFISNPIIKKYVDLKAKSESVYSKKFRNIDGKKIDPLKDIYKELFADDLELTNTDIDSLENYQIKSLADVYFGKTSEDGSYTGDVEFNSKDLENLAKGRTENMSEEQIDKLNKDVFMHFIQIQDMTSRLTEFKLATNFDTKTSRTSYDVNTRAAALDELSANQYTGVPSEMIDNLKKRTPISSFIKSGELMRDVLEKVFILRNNKYLNSSLSDVINSTGADGFVYKNYAGDWTKASSDFKNEFQNYLVQNAIADSIDDGEYFQSYAMEDAIPTKKASNIKTYMAAVVDGVLYVDEKAIEAEINKAYNKRKKGVQLYDLIVKNENGEQRFKTNESVFLTPKQFRNFMLTQAVLRDQFKLEDVITSYKFKNEIRIVKENNPKLTNAEVVEKAYNMYIRHKALDEIYSHDKMFYHKTNSFAHEYASIKKTFSKQLGNLEFFKNTLFKKQKTDAVKKEINITLLDRNIDTALIDIINEELVMLKNANKVAELLNKESNDRDVLDIVDFFNKLEVYSLMQSGFKTNSTKSINKLVDQRTIINILSRESQKFLGNEDAQQSTVENFAKIFVNKIEGDDRYRSTNYTTNFESSSASDLVEMSIEGEDSVSGEENKSTVAEEVITKEEIKAGVSNQIKELDETTLDDFIKKCLN